MVHPTRIFMKGVGLSAHSLSLFFLSFFLFFFFFLFSPPLTSSSFFFPDLLCLGSSRSKYNTLTISYLLVVVVSFFLLLHFDLNWKKKKKMGNLEYLWENKTVTGHRQYSSGNDRKEKQTFLMVPLVSKIRGTKKSWECARNLHRHCLKLLENKPF